MYVTVYLISSNDAVNTKKIPIAFIKNEAVRLFPVISLNPNAKSIKKPAIKNIPVIVNAIATNMSKYASILIESSNVNLGAKLAAIEIPKIVKKLEIIDNLSTAVPSRNFI